MEKDLDSVNIHIDNLPLSLEELNSYKTDLVLYAKNEIQDATKWMMLIPKVCETVENIKISGKKLIGSDKKKVTIAIFNIVMKDTFSVDEDYITAIIDIVNISIDTIIDVSKGKFKINTRFIIEVIKKFLSCFIKI